MDVLVRWVCNCGAPRWACPQCRGKGMVVHGRCMRSTFF